MRLLSLKAIMGMAVIAIIIEVIILMQEPCHNSTAFHGQKARATFIANYTIFATENGKIFLLYLNDKKHEYLRI